MTPFDQLRLCPPWLCRLMAIEPGSAPYHHTQFGFVPVPLDRLVEQSGIPRRTFQRISYLDSFDDVKHGLVEKFYSGCKVDPFDAVAISEFMQTHGEHLFKLAPHSLSRDKLREMDKRLAKMVEEKNES